MIQLPKQTPLPFPLKADKWPRASDSCGFKSSRLSRSSRLLAGPQAAHHTHSFLQHEAQQPTQSTRLFQGQSWGQKWRNHTSFRILPTRTLELDRLWVYPVCPEEGISNIIMYPSQQIPSSPQTTKRKPKLKKHY